MCQKCINYVYANLKIKLISYQYHIIFLLSLDLLQFATYYLKGLL